MKKFVSIFLFMVVAGVCNLYAQAPQLINYQAVARNASGQTLINQPVSVRLSVRQSSAGGTIQYQETHSLTSTAQGLVNLQIGNGVPNTGTFTSVTWSDGQPKYLQIELDPDAAGAQPFADMGTQQLASVPYALYCEQAKWVAVSGANTRVGNSGYSLSGADNTATGFNTLSSNTTGNRNTANGYGALRLNTTGDDNTANGSYALFVNTTGGFNTANGHGALFLNTTGSGNTATGAAALYNNTTGDDNTANGVSSLRSNTDGGFNTANGKDALRSNTTGSGNTATGAAALYSNTTGNNNTANGLSSLISNTIGFSNTANGNNALYSNTTGFENTATGVAALNNNTTGNNNTANGNNALFSNTEGDYNTAIGMYALYDNVATRNNTALGYSAGDFTIGAEKCTMIGTQAGFNADNFTNSTALGYNAPITGNNQINLGNAAISSIKGQVGFTTYSDQRFKTNVQTNVKGLDFILKLRPVTYNVNAPALDGFLHQGYTPRHKDETAEQLNRQGLEQKANITYTGFLAQEVEQAAQAAGFDFSGVDKPQNEKDLYGLRYAEFVVPLVKAVQEQQAIIETQNQTIEKLNAELQLIKEKLGLK